MDGQDLLRTRITLLIHEKGGNYINNIMLYSKRLQLNRNVRTLSEI